MPRSSEIICLRIFAFTTPFRFINQRTYGDLYSRVLVFVLRVILMTPNHLLLHCHHSPFSQQAAGCPIRTFSFHLHTRLLLAVYNFKAHNRFKIHTVTFLCIHYYTFTSECDIQAMQFMERICLLAGSQTMDTKNEIIGLPPLQLVKLFHPSLSFACMHVHIPGGAKNF